MEKRNLEKVYEKFLEDVEPTEEMKVLYDKLSDQIMKLRSNASFEMVEELDKLEELYSRINDLETKAAFYKGFSVATNIILEAKD